MGGKYMRAPPDASLVEKGRAKAKKAVKKAGTGAAALQGFRKYTSPTGIQVTHTHTPTHTHTHPIFLQLGKLHSVC